MSRTRTLSDTFYWSDEIRAVELLDWETRPEDFDRLCEFIVTSFAEREGLSRDRLFKILLEEEFRTQLHYCAEAFTEQSTSLVVYVYMRMKHLVVGQPGDRERGK